MPGNFGNGSRGQKGFGRQGRGRGNRPGTGPSGQCICPHCGATVFHQRATPCFQQKCPECGSYMVRQ